MYPIAELLPKPPSTVRLVIISDTHERHRDLLIPPGDVLIHCGDIQEGLRVFRSTSRMLSDFAAWINDPKLHPHPVKLIISGNHDKALAAMRVEDIRKLFSPALYLCDESAVVQPFGLRFYGSPRSIANSCFSPNTAFQGLKWWRPFMFRTDETSGDGATTSNDASDAKKKYPAASGVTGAVSVHLEGTRPQGPIDVLLTHQSPDTPPPRHTVENQAICTYALQVAPRRLHCTGHLHGAHGIHRLPVPFTVAEKYCIVSPVDCTYETMPYLPCINAAMMQRRGAKTVLLPPSVIDLEL